MKRISKVAKYQIVKSLNLTWDELTPQLRFARNETRNILNRSIQHLWTLMVFREDYKREHGKYPPRETEKQFTGNAPVKTWLYQLIVPEHPFLYTSNICQTIQLSIQRFQASYKDILRGTMSVPSYKRDQPIDIHSQNLKITKDDRGFLLRTSLLNTDGKEHLGISHKGKLELVIHPGDGSGKTILNRILNGEYKTGSSKIKQVKSKWMLYLTYQFDAQEQSLDPKKIMGIDLGIVVPICLAYSDSKLMRYSFNEARDEITHFRTTLEARRRSLLRQGKVCGDGRKGHGRNTRIAPIEAISHKVSNFRDTCNHKYSRRVIEMAKKKDCGVIQMENLEGISKDDKFLKNWTYYDLQQKIKYKAEEAGIEVRFVEPRYTSKRCSECGHVSRDNRIDQAHFKCVKCGYEENADFNAARNLATDGIEVIIDEEVKDWDDVQPKKNGCD